MAGPDRNFTELHFPSCCRDVLRRMHRCIEAGKALREFLAWGPFLSLLAESPPLVLYHLVEGDWDVFGRAMKAVPFHIRSECAEAAGLHSLEHPGGDLHRFWSVMNDQFSS
jgi:hypothetical protein